MITMMKNALRRWLIELIFGDLCFDIPQWIDMLKEYRDMFNRQGKLIEACKDCNETIRTSLCLFDFIYENEESIYFIEADAIKYFGDESVCEVRKFTPNKHVPEKGKSPVQIDVLTQKYDNTVIAFGFNMEKYFKDAIDIRIVLTEDDNLKSEISLVAKYKDNPDEMKVIYTWKENTEENDDNVRN